MEKTLGVPGREFAFLPDAASPHTSGLIASPIAPRSPGIAGGLIIPARTIPGHAKALRKCVEFVSGHAV
ncbi:hypothetical protein [Paenibacillus sp. UNC496MF]|uniref:hypothetical protein n=1 Tax=Paenibacillus sp. UNC496MF TaxID=1502753 RepID=UPI00210AC200|nr:hypothetical protein [Paenibacillus sp. UNC496MF]